MQLHCEAIARALDPLLDASIPSPQSIFIQDIQSIEFTEQYLARRLPPTTPFISTHEAYNARLVVDRVLSAYGIEGASVNPIERVIDALSTFRGDFNKRFIVISSAHKLKHYDNLLVTLLRLAEIIHSPITLILLSNQPYTTLRPTNGLSPDPVLVNIPAVPQKDILAYLVEKRPSNIGENLHNTYLSLCNFIMSSTLTLNTQPNELLKITYKSWPKFIEPWKELDARPSLRDNDLLTMTFAKVSKSVIQSINSNLPDHMDLLQASLPTDLTRCAQLLLIASYLASYNPPKKDTQLLSIAADPSARQRRSNRRREGSSSKLNKKPAQQLLGPKNFSFDRWLHVYGSLLHFVSEASLTTYSLNNLKFDTSLFTDNELGQVDILDNVAHLTRIKMVQRTCPHDRLDGMTFKCAIGYHVASNLAKTFGVRLHEFLWDVS
ncbi:hypothetical protein E3P99_01645 [Wallemia hederae]|uniref:Origin recognition complex subunit 5 C-terminal domain-containing protein n=1 Tax=Wallemia hederae TaxID=1540922 RepID=A0A4V4LTG3_9BASI|nr:hypothetical protein E3P99_01645 [Wallemia hederae]